MEMNPVGEDAIVGDNNGGGTIPPALALENAAIVEIGDGIPTPTPILALLLPADPRPKVTGFAPGIAPIFTGLGLEAVGAT